jgi:hypothetical protein
MVGPTPYVCITRPIPLPWRLAPPDGVRAFVAGKALRGETPSAGGLRHVQAYAAAMQVAVHQAMFRAAVHGCAPVVTHPAATLDVALNVRGGGGWRYGDGASGPSGSLRVGASPHVRCTHARHVFQH